MIPTAVRDYQVISPSVSGTNDV